MEELNTVSIYLTDLNNRSVKYCLVNNRNIILPTYEEEKVKELLLQLRDTGVQKVIFSGGEPFLLKNSFISLLKYSHSLGLINSVNTNGSLLTQETIEELKFYIDEVNLYVDSLSSIKNIQIGTFNSTIDEIDYYNIVYILKKASIKINIITTITIFNQYDDLQDFINFVKPNYWLIKEPSKKLLNYSSIKSENNNFQHFISKHIYKNVVFNLDITTIDINQKQITNE